MADLNITIADVARVSGGVCEDFTAGVALTAGMLVYLNASSQWVKAEATTGPLTGAGARVGICLNSALAIGMPVAVQETGQITIGAYCQAPVQAAAVAAASGSLTDTDTYYWVITAITAAGETTASNEETLTMSSPDLTANLSWGAVANATGYKVYRGTTTGMENKLITTISNPATTTYSDTGAAGTTHSPPVSNTAASVVVGEVYVKSPNNAGGIAPFADLGSGNYIDLIGIGISATVIDMAYKGAYPGAYTGIVAP